MAKIKLFVKLKIPDATAITAFHTLERMGYKELKKLEREDYYEFTVAKDEEKFAKDIVKVDIVVNANKHSTRMLKEGEKEEEQSDHHIIMVLVKDTGNKSLGLLSTLRERIGFSNLAEISRGIFWKMHIDAKNTADAKEIAEKITKDLLYNTHYQEYEIVE